MWKTTQLSGKGGAVAFNSSGTTALDSCCLPSDGSDASVVGQWFAIYTASRHEKRVADHFRLRQIEHFLPLYAVRHRWKNGLVANLQLPLFPGYLFARFHGREERVRILQVPGVLSVVGGAECQCAAIADAVIEGLRQGLDLHRIEPHPGIGIGERVRIASGLMAGMPGILIRRRRDFRVVITLSQILQSISIEVDEALIEPLPPASTRNPWNAAAGARRTAWNVRPSEPVAAKA
jgi:transcription antitermination factor NusG